MTRRDWRHAKQLGFSDAQLGYLWHADAGTVRAARLAAGVAVTYKTVDTCAAEFDAHTPYHYGTYEDEDELTPVTRPAVVILGSGPNRIGQGVEFDYCCVHAAFALHRRRLRDRHGQLQPRDRLDRLRHQRPAVLRAPHRRGRPATSATACSRGRDRSPGVIVSLGGQTPLKLARILDAAGVPILGTSPASIDAAEDRERFNALCADLEHPPAARRHRGRRRRRPARSPRRSATRSWSGPPTCSAAAPWRSSTTTTRSPRHGRTRGATGILGREGGLSAERPALIDRFLEDAVEVDVDALRDRTGDVLIGGVMEHIEQAGVHSGDSACAIPPPTLPATVLATRSRRTPTPSPTRSTSSAS